MSVPDDFPTEPGDRPDGIAARHAACISMVEQLAGYCIRRDIVRTRAALAEALSYYRMHPKSPRWEESPAELEWCKEQVIKLLSKTERCDVCVFEQCANANGGGYRHACSVPGRPAI